MNPSKFRIFLPILCCILALLRTAQSFPQLSRSPSSRSNTHFCNIPCCIRAELETTKLRGQARSGWFLKSRPDDNDLEDDDEEDLIDFENKDWRAFRAQLVTGGSTCNTTVEESPLSSIGTSWAYDSGRVIEEGSIILSQPQQDFCNGLQQQYFHKCVILVLEHDENMFTRGVILNRPSDMVLSDNDFEYDDGSPLENADEKNTWHVWFGGDVHGILSESPEIVCLHSLKTDAAKEMSRTILKEIQWTTFEAARKLVDSGDATSSDFWIFCGYSGWDAGQLMDELERKAWYMVAADSQTLLQQLAKQSQEERDPREAGIDTWNKLMTMIDRSDEMRRASSDNNFEDLMLREWAKEMLVYDKEHTDSTEKVLNDILAAVSPTSEDDAGDAKLDYIDALIKRATESASKVPAIPEGTLLRGSSLPRSPFLLSGQEFHKSIVLIVQDDGAVSIGLLLNHPSTKTYNLNVNDNKEAIKVIQRYGGKYGVEGESEKPYVWLHYSKALRDAKVGSPVGDDNGIYKCTPKDAAQAIGSGVATIEDFMVVNGFSVWPKAEGGVAGGIRGEVWQGNFEVVPASQAPSVWNKLMSQELLSTMTFDRNLMLANDAWSLSGGQEKKAAISKEEDEVFNTEVKISTLCNDALRCWVATYLLGKASFLKEEYSSAFE